MSWCFDLFLHLLPFHINVLSTWHAHLIGWTRSYLARWDWPKAAQARSCASPRLQSCSKCLSRLPPGAAAAATRGRGSAELGGGGATTMASWGGGLQRGSRTRPARGGGPRRAPTDQVTRRQRHDVPFRQGRCGSGGPRQGRKAAAAQLSPAGKRRRRGSPLQLQGRRPARGGSPLQV